LRVGSSDKVGAYLCFPFDAIFPSLLKQALSANAAYFSAIYSELRNSLKIKLAKYKCWESLVFC